MVDEEEPEARFEASKRASTIERLFRVARRLDELARDRVRERSGMPLRAAHTQLFPHLDLQGTRLTVLAQRLGVTKQAVAPAIDELVSWGVLEKVPDPSDGRARLVRFHSMASLLEGMGALHDLEDEIAREVGRDPLDQVRAVLHQIDQWLDDRAQPRGPS